MNLDTLVNYFIGGLIATAFLFGFGYIGYKLTENYCPQCYGCVICFYDCWCCWIPIITSSIGLSFCMAIMITIQQNLEKYIEELEDKIASEYN
jgi:hypothetical protein